MTYIEKADLDAPFRMLGIDLEKSGKRITESFYRIGSADGEGTRSFLVGSHENALPEKYRSGRNLHYVALVKGLHMWEILRPLKVWRSTIKQVPMQVFDDIGDNNLIFWFYLQSDPQVKSYLGVGLCNTRID